MKMKLLMLVPLLALGACETMTAERTTFEENCDPVPIVSPAPDSASMADGVRLSIQTPDAGPQGVYQPSQAQNRGSSHVVTNPGTPGKRKGTTTKVTWTSLNGKTLGAMAGTVYQALDGAAPGGLLPWLLGGAGGIAGIIGTAITAIIHGRAKDKAWDASQLATLMMMQGRLPTEPIPPGSNQGSDGSRNSGT